MTRTEAIALLLCLVIPGLFVVFEAAALTQVAPWHTISFYAQHDSWLDYAIIAAAVAALLVFIGWWRHHMRSKIER